MFITKQTHALYGKLMLKQEAHLISVFGFEAKGCFAFCISTRTEQQTESPEYVIM